MRIDIISAVPKLLESPLQNSILKNAQDKQLLEVILHDLRDFTLNKHRKIDDYAYGGGAGMVLQVEPIARCIRMLQSKRSYDEIIFMTPTGKTFDQKDANQLSLKENIIILAGHYKGVDQRAIDMFVTQEISVGDFVLSGGELPALILVDAIARLIPGVLGNEQSALEDSFQGDLLDSPVYTRPADFEGVKVPEILLSGNFKKIEEWKLEKAIKLTKKRKPELWKKHLDND